MGYISAKLPEWNVYIGDINSRQIRTHNVFDHGSLLRDLSAVLRRLKRDKTLTDDERREQFTEALRKNMMYYYWSKCEWEVLIDHWPPHESCKKEKVDVYDQVKLNWDQFVRYAWEHREDILKCGLEIEKKYKRK